VPSAEADNEAMRREPTSVLRRVLVVEDDPSVAECTAKLLRAEGFDVVLETDPEAALRAATQEPFTAIVCDQGLRGMKGLDLLRRLAETKPSLVRRFVLATGAANDAEVRRFKSARPRRALIKPYARDELLAAIEDAAGLPTPRDATPLPTAPAV
jgi:CheY-like chemotaxis protein